MSNNFRKPSCAFTLLELLIALVIVALLAGIAVPTYQKQVIKGHREQAKAALSELISVIELLRARSATGTLSSLLVPEDLLGRIVERYTITIVPNPIEVESEYWVKGIPRSGTDQIGNGGLTLTSQGRGCWHKSTDTPVTHKCTGLNEHW